MAQSGWSVGVFVGALGIWFAGTTQHERALVGGERTAPIASLETRVALLPDRADAIRELVQVYLDARQPGLALAAIERAPAALRADPSVEHLYARALLDQGRSGDALAAERRVLARCADDAASAACSAHLVASATRRADILRELVQLGVEDAVAQPEASNIAYQNATRQVTLSVH